MTSPWRREETTSPSARLLRDEHRHRRTSQHSPYRQKADTVSSSVWDEFSRLYIDENRDFHKTLDEQLAEQEQRHRDALAAAAAEHERVREGAERAREKVELELERERKRREEDERRELNAMRKAEAERDAAERQKVKEELEREKEEQRKRVEEEKEIETTRARLAEQKRKDEVEAARRKQEVDEAEKRDKERSAAVAATIQVPPQPSQSAQPAQPTATSISSAPTQPAQATQNTQSQAPPATALQPPTKSSVVPSSQTGPSSSNTDGSLAAHEALHKRYLDLHKQLKSMRRYVVTESKKYPQLKKLSDWRRELNKTFGQLTTEKAANRRPLMEAMRILQEALRHPEPSVDVSSYIISSETDGSPIPMPGAFVYLLNIFSKGLINQMINEVGGSTLSGADRAEKADPLGIMAVTIFAQPHFKARNSIPLIDIFLAKYHFACPVLWGIYGSEKTRNGRRRIGWRSDDDGFDTEQTHSERMTGLGALYGAIALRDFSKSKNESPYPPSNYWRALSCIINTPASEVQSTHFYVLKALVDGHVPRFIGFYGQAALVALRKALVDFPSHAARSPARDAVMVLPEGFRKELHLSL